MLNVWLLTCTGPIGLVQSIGWLLFDGGTYIPMGVCFFIRDAQFVCIYTCEDDKAHVSIDNLDEYQFDNVTVSVAPNNDRIIKNVCLYEPKYGTYKIDACTVNMWTTFRYLLMIQLYQLYHDYLLNVNITYSI